MRNVKQFSADKILNHLDRVCEWLSTGYSRPITCELDMTNICNHRCPFCFGFASNSKDNLTIDKAKDIIKQIKDFGGRGLTFTGGGEPLLNPATLEAVKYAKSIGLDVGFITNGSFLTEEACEVILDNCVWIRISVDADCPETFKISHGMPEIEFKKILENVEVLVRMKKKKAKTTVGIGYLTFENEKIIEGIVPFAKLGKKLGVDYVQYRPLLKKFRMKEINKKTNKKILTNIEEALKYATADFEVLYSRHKYEDMKNNKTHRHYGKCYGHHFATVIAADMKMYLCCHMRGVKKYCLGDLNTQSLREIWHSEQRKNVYENIDFNDCPLLCRCNTFNEILWSIKTERRHKNFL